ncbi:MAG: hypothetical protein OXC96_07685 [Cyanobacteria bacterium MAG CAR1_bin_15]|nr:hypothetical protein [Cyanobacteria bacterium MAG CAR1_bin_15]
MKDQKVSPVMSHHPSMAVGSAISAVMKLSPQIVAKVQALPFTCRQTLAMDGFSVGLAGMLISWIFEPWPA